MYSLLKKFKTIDSIALTFLVSLYYLLVMNLTIARKIYHILSDLPDVGFLFTLSVPLFFFSAFVIIFTPFVSRFIAKPLLIFLVLTSACISYGAYYFGIIFNKDMMVNIFETTPAEAGSYLNLKLIIWLILTGIVPSLYIAWVKITYRPFLKELLRKIILIAAAASMILLIAAFFYKDYASIARNNPKMQKDIVPTYYISSTLKYIKATFFTKPLPYQHIALDAKRVKEEEDERYLFVVLVGETARAQNYQWNGYAKETNAYTHDLPNIISFKNVKSCGTATAVSLPCMFSTMSQSNYSREKFDSQDNLVDILKRAGYQQVWIDNNTGCKGICRNIESHAVADMPSIHCKGEECTDRVFLQVLNEQIQALDGQDAVIYLHLLGSHGPSYYERYPKEHAKFKPDCQTSNLQNCTEEEIINAYDNTILFTDYIMAEVIKALDQYKDDYYTGVVYLSDHGESLGENGIYLHGMPYTFAPEQQTHIPLMLWFSDRLLKHEDTNIACLQNVAQEKSFSHDYFSHTLLELMDIETKDYDPTKNFLSLCEKKEDHE